MGLYRVQFAAGPAGAVSRSRQTTARVRRSCNTKSCANDMSSLTSLAPAITRHFSFLFLATFPWWLLITLQLKKRQMFLLIMSFTLDGVFGGPWRPMSEHLFYTWLLEIQFLSEPSASSPLWFFRPIKQFIIQIQCALYRVFQTFYPFTNTDFLRTLIMYKQYEIIYEDVRIFYIPNRLGI